MRLDLALKAKSKAIEAMRSANKLMAQLHASSVKLTYVLGFHFTFLGLAVLQRKAWGDEMM